MLYWNSCWTVNESFRKMSGRGFKVSAVFSSLNPFLLTRTMSKEQLVWLLLDWLASVTTLFFYIFHFLISVYFLICTPYIARVVHWCSCWTQRGRSSCTWQPPWRPLNWFPKTRCICMIQQQQPSAAAALRSELLCCCAALYGGHFQSSFLSRSWPSSSMTCGPYVSILAESDTRVSILLCLGTTLKTFERKILSAT